MINYIEFGERHNQYGVLTFFNKITNDTDIKMKICMATIPEEIQCSSNKMFSFYFEYGKFIHINQIVIDMDKLYDEFENLKWKIYNNEEFPCLCSIVLGLNCIKYDDLLIPEYKNNNLKNSNIKYNVGNGFFIIMYKEDCLEINELEKEEIQNIINRVFDIKEDK